MTHPRSLAVLALVGVFAACADTATDPAITDDTVTDDVAQIAADGALADLDGISATAPTANGRFPAEAVFRDAGGRVMGAYDPLLTESVSMTLSRSATIDRGNVTGTIVRRRAITVSGLTGEETERIHDGRGSDERSRVAVRDGGGTRSYDASSRVAISGVARAVDRTTRPWPLSGSITRELQVRVVNGRGGAVERRHVSVLTFDGTRYARLIVNGEHFQVDLARRGHRAAEPLGPTGRSPDSGR